VTPCPTCRQPTSTTGVEQLANTTQFFVRSTARGVYCSHLGWLVWVTLSTGCGGAESLKTVSVQVTPATDADSVDATVPATSDAERAGGSTCLVTPAYLRDRKTCARDSECEAVSYRPDCCATMRWVGVAVSALADVRACADAAPAVCVTCAVRPTRAEDGRSGATEDVVARCVEGQCRAVVETRHCGDVLTCKANELCVASGNVPGSALPAPGSGDVLISYTCAPNPCRGEIDCSCAQPLCDARKDAVRLCEIEFSADADVQCVPMRT
jgi:hypothetical protein